MKKLLEYKSYIVGFFLMITLMTVFDISAVDERLSSEIELVNYVSMISAYIVAMFFLTPKSRKE